ncbi:TD and POZ domain-containing protein 1 [Caerostris extrusa]|uniref:TD and POZ domain-containing protein 1 n=1 Tax=Caerostris extrusa TaxID=172846 RepID=A0AAV4PQJ5_CAEEX|nr:TD and POZ domain-containing protein 1 [Caerostris extrusa]
MAAVGCAEEKCFTFTWKLENMSYCWQNNKEPIFSPKFVVDALEGTKWRLSLYPRRAEVGNYIGYFLNRDKDCSSGVNDIEINYVLSFMAADGSVLQEYKAINRIMSKDKGEGFPTFVTRNKVFFKERFRFLPDDTLTARCRMWRSDGKTTEDGKIYARTRIRVESRSVGWNIEKFSQLEPYKAITFPINSTKENKQLMNLDLYLTGGQKFEEVLHFKLTAVDRKIKMSTIQLSLLDNAGGKTECVKGEVWFNSPENLHRQLTFQTTRNRLMAAKDVYLLNDVLSVLCECTFSTGVVLGEIEAVHCNDKDSIPEQSIANLADELFVLKVNLRSSFEEGFMSDVKLKAKTCSFPAHKVILSARSPVFKAMFSSDMRESMCDIVDIRDMDDDTVRRMLQFMYTADVDDLGWSSASDLYAAADKYEVLTLKEKCSCYLKANLRPSNACEALIFSDLHQEEGLKHAVQDFILKHSWEVMNSDEWKQLMETDLKLAAETMSDGKTTQNERIYARTRLGAEKRSAVWNIDEFSEIELYQAISFPIKSSALNEELMNLDLCLTGGQNFEEVLHFKLTARDPEIKMSTIQLSLLDNAGGKTEGVNVEVWFNAPENLDRQLSLMSQVTRNRLMPTKHVYLPNDVLSVLCECTFFTGVVLEEIDAVRYGDKDSIPEKPLSNLADEVSVLKINLRSLIKEGFMSDVKLKVLTLKEKCSSYLKANLTSSNACALFILADLHLDVGLKHVVYDFILKHSWEVMKSDEWKQMMETDPKLAAETMHITFKE